MSLPPAEREEKIVNGENRKGLVKPAYTRQLYKNRKELPQEQRHYPKRRAQMFK